MTKDLKLAIKNYLKVGNKVYQRAGIVLPNNIRLIPTLSDAKIEDQTLDLAVPQSLIDIQTALAEGCIITLHINIYQEIKEGSHLEIPESGDLPIELVKILLVGYDRTAELFKCVDEENKYFTISYDYILNDLLAFELWTIRN